MSTAAEKFIMRTDAIDAANAKPVTEQQLAEVLDKAWANGTLSLARWILWNFNVTEKS